MRFKELFELRRTKVVAEPVPYNPGWEHLNDYRQRGHAFGTRMATEMPQLFMPRPAALSKTRREKRLANLSNVYAWQEDDPAKLKSNYADWEDSGPIHEGAPILLGRAPSPPGDNKPHATFWTSTAKKLENGSYTSSWVNWVSNNQPEWMSDTGYLYRVKPNSIVLRLDSDYDAENLVGAFKNLGRVTEVDPSDIAVMYKIFPWDQLAKHFDGVHHYPYGRNEFLYGWDVESTAWLNTDVLELIGEVPIGLNNED
jgi:hypothetical protein